MAELTLAWWKNATKDVKVLKGHSIEKWIKKYEEDLKDFLKPGTEAWLLC